MDRGLSRASITPHNSAARPSDSGSTRLSPARGHDAAISGLAQTASYEEPTAAPHRAHDQKPTVRQRSPATPPPRHRPAPIGRVPDMRPPAANSTPGARATARPEPAPHTRVRRRARRRAHTVDGGPLRPASPWETTTPRAHQGRPRWIKKNAHS